MGGKSLEKVLRNRTNERLGRQELIKVSKYDILKDWSYLITLTDYFEEVTKYINESGVVDVVYMNLTQ